MRKYLVLFTIIMCLLSNTSCSNLNNHEVMQQTLVSSIASSITSSNTEVINDVTKKSANTLESTSQASNENLGFYFNSRYYFSINYPVDWAASDESPAGDGINLYEKDGNDIRVYGGYIINDFIDNQIKEFKASGLEVGYLINDNGEKGTLITGKIDDKVLFHFILLGKEFQCQFYALVTPAYYDKNKSILMNTAKQLFLDEEPDLPEIKNIDRLAVYKKYIEELVPKHLRNIQLAENAFKSLATSDKSTNDKLFRFFRSFYNSVIDNNESYFTDGGESISNNLLTSYGLRINGSESGEFIAEAPEYLYDHFSSYLSDGLNEFLSIRMKHFTQYPATYLIEDAALSTSWDNLSDWIIDWEKYIAQYPECVEIENAKSDLKFFLELYFLDFHLDNTPMFENNMLTREVQDSYLRFLKLYPDSKYNKIVKGYYNILKQNNLKLNKEATDYLAQNGIKFDFENSTSEGYDFSPDFTGIKEIMNLKKDEILNKLGPDYKIIKAGAEGQEKGYYYEKYGMTLIFSSLAPEVIDLIECTEKVDIMGARIGMCFEEIQKILGGGETIDLVQIEPNQPNYALFYEFGNLIVWFGASEKDGAATDLQIRQSNN